MGLFACNQVVAESQRRDTIADVKDRKETGGANLEQGEVAETEDTAANIDKKENSSNRSLTKSGVTRNLEIRRFYARIKDGSSGTELVSLPNSEYRISYIYEGKEIFIYGKGTTNEKGEILNLPAMEIPAEVTQIRFRYYLGNEKRGYIKKYNNIVYQFVVSQNISSSGILNGYSNFWVGSTTDPDRYFYNFHAAKLNFFYDESVKEFSNIITKTNELLLKTVPFNVEPINMFFEKGEYLDQNNGFWRNGHKGNKIADITIADNSNRQIFNDQSIKSKVMHEWTHWNSWRETQRGQDKETAPLTIRNSYREGWAYLIGRMYAEEYDLSKEEFIVQNDNKDGINRYFGKPTIMTVKQVLCDLLDVSSQDEDFSLSHRFIDEEISELDQRKLNLGLLHTIMVESKATTLQEFLNYMENKYILTASDVKRYEKVLEINGLNRDGSFRFNEDGSPLTKNSPSVQVNESENTVCSGVMK